MTVAKPVAANLALPRRRKPVSPVARLAATPVLAPLVPLLRAVVPPLLGLLAFLLLWTLVSQLSKGSLPGPVSTWASARELFADPFYQNGPNDQGIGWNILMSLGRVGAGFGMAALVGIPLGFMLGRFEFLSRMVNPLVSLLRPVSPSRAASTRCCSRMISIRWIPPSATRSRAGRRSAPCSTG